MGKLTKNYIYNCIYQFLTIAVTFILTPYLTRTLGKNALGIDSYVLSVVQMTNVLGALGTNVYANREIAYARDSEKKISQVFFEILYIRIALCSIAIFIYLFIGLNSEYKTVFLIQTITVISYFLDVSWLFIGLEEMKQVVIKNILVKFGVTCSIFLFVKSADDIYLYIFLSALGQAAGSLLMLMQCRRYIKIRHKEYLDIKRHIKPILELFLPQAATSLYVFFDKIMLGLFSNDISSVSVYDKGEILVKAPIAFATAMTSVVMPRIAKEFSQGHDNKVKELVQNSINFVIAFFLPITFGMYIIAPIFCPWYLGESYHESIYVVQILCPIILAIALTNVSGAQYMVATNDSKYLTISYIVSAISNLLGNYFLIPILDARGAAISTVISEWLVVIIQYTRMRGRLGQLNIIKHNWKKFFSTGIMTFGIYIITSITPAKYENSIYLVAVQVFIGALIYFVSLTMIRDRELLNLFNVIQKIIRRQKNNV